MDSNQEAYVALSTTFQNRWTQLFKETQERDFAVERLLERCEWCRNFNNDGAEEQEMLPPQEQHAEAKAVAARRRDRWRHIICWAVTNLTLFVVLCVLSLYWYFWMNGVSAENDSDRLHILPRTPAPPRELCRWRDSERDSVSERMLYATCVLRAQYLDFAQRALNRVRWW